MRKFQMYIKRGHLGLKGLPIMVNNELKALWSNKQIIYSSLISPILYFLFYSVGIQATFEIYHLMERRSVFFPIL